MDGCIPSLNSRIGPVPHRAPAGWKVGLFPVAVTDWLAMSWGHPSAVPWGLCVAAYSLSDGRRASAESVFFSFSLSGSFSSFIRQGC